MEGDLNEYTVQQLKAALKERGQYFASSEKKKKKKKLNNYC